MNKINCAIIDRDPQACEMLRSYIEQTSFLRLTGIYNTASSAIRHLTEKPTDMVFMDVQMPDISGLDLRHMLPTETKVVFTTASREYAVEAFRLGAVDYLLKPINFNEFMQSANKAASLIEQRNKIEGNMVAVRPTPVSREVTTPFVFVKTDYKTVRIDFEDLLFIEGQRDHVRFHLRQAPGEPIQSLVSMKLLLHRLPKPKFLRIHRSYIVHTRFIDSIERGEVVIGDTRLPISDGYKSDLVDFVREHTL